MKIKRKKPKIKKVLKTCCWCEKRISDNQEVFAFECKKQPDIDISRFEGDIMPIFISSINKTLWAIVPTEESDARLAGTDFMFTICSRECGTELKEALNQEKQISETLLSSEIK